MTKRIDGTLTGRRVFAVRVATTTPEKLAELALERGYYFIGAGGERQKRDDSPPPDHHSRTPVVEKATSADCWTLRSK